MSSSTLNPRKGDDASEGSFGGFDEEEDNSHNAGSAGAESDAESFDDSDSDSDRRRVDTAVFDDEKDSDEEDLERFVLGNKASFRQQLFRDDLLPTSTDSDSAALAKKPNQSVPGQQALNDAALFVFDTDKPSAEKPLVHLPKDTEELADKPAWEDSDDERLTVSLANATRLRKLRTTEADDVINGTEYARRLRQQYLRLYPLPEWAQDPATTAGGKRGKGSRRRRSSASRAGSSDASSEGDENSDGDEPDSANPLDAFLRDANSFNGSGARKRRKLRPETIDIQKTRDLPDVHKAAVSSLSFHPRHPIILSSSTSSVMHLHHFDPAAHPTPNPPLASVQVQRTDLRRTAFLGPDGDEVVFAGRRRYFHSWNLSTGVVRRVSQIQGVHAREQRTMERFRLSPCGRFMALVSSDRKGGGAVNVLAVATMQWVAQARPNGCHGVADLAWWADGQGLTIAGRDGQVTEWSMANRRTVGVWRDEGSIGGTVMALGGRGGPAALGGDRWVAVGSTSGIVNVYDRNLLLAEGGAGANAIVSTEGGDGAGEKEEGAVEIKKLPEPTRAFEQLTTAVTVLTFSPDGQLLAFGSQHKKDALRLAHLPSCTVYRNWPTEQTPLGRVTAVAFGAHSEVLAVGNDAGKVRLWEIRN